MSEGDAVGRKRRREPSLVERFRQHYNRYASPAGLGLLQYINGAAAYFIWFMAINVLYTSSKYTIPYYFGEVWGLGDMGLYWCKVPLVWGIIQVLANWLCLRAYDSRYRVSEDRPNLNKSLWDIHPLERAKKDDDAFLDNSRGRRDPRRLPWGLCHVCHMDQPPRSHHCKICNGCILKRDHHCFLVGTCIGHYNQRYFVVFTFYTALYSYVLLFLTHIYMTDNFWPNVGYMDYLLPWTIMRAVIGGAYEFKFVLMMCHYYVLVWCAPMCTSFFIFQMIIIPTGKTRREFVNQECVRTMSMSENYRSVFGEFWVVNFILPAVILFRQPSDGTEWNVYRYPQVGRYNNSD